MRKPAAIKLRSKVLVTGCALTALLIAIASLGAVLAQAAGDPAAGKAVFTSSGCGGCHTLADAGAKGKSASNFDTTKPGFDAIVAALTSPPPGMPTSSLTDQQVQDLAAYIVAVAGNQAPGGGQTGGDTGGGGTEDGRPGGATQSTVRVTLKGWKIKLVPKQVTAGVVTFKIRNAGRRGHQLSLIRTPANPHALSVKRGRVSEARRIGKKINKLRFKKTRKTSRTLPPGSYILIDNQRGNYKKGRFALLTVTEAPSTVLGTVLGPDLGAGQPPPSPAGPQLSPGAQAFLDAGCGGCHTLADAGAMGTGASSLDIGKPSYATVKSVVTSGIENSLGSLLVPKEQQAMPAYDGKLTAQEIGDLADYVSTVTGGGDGSTQPPGRQAVLRLGCGACHTLADVDAKATTWSSLDVAKPSKTTVKAVVTNGIENRYWDYDDDGPFNNGTWDDRVMPAYDTALTAQEIKDVGNYVSSVTGGGKAQPAGRQPFLKGGCGSCHTFADAGVKGTYSTNFDLTRPTRATVGAAMGMGRYDYPANTMPTYPYAGQPGDLSNSEVTDIATYISGVVGSGEGGGPDDDTCQVCHDYPE